ncbi:MAG: hypothetical protein IJ389_00535 [Clostridia bacterium]|nr:hypothetical protein [Clostridia bacterium]
MRTNEAFKAEVLRRSSIVKSRQRSLRKILLTCIPLIICCTFVAIYMLKTISQGNIADGAENANDIIGMADGATISSAVKAVISDTDQNNGKDLTVENSTTAASLYSAITNALHNNLQVLDDDIACEGYTVTFTMSSGAIESYTVSGVYICFDSQKFLIGDRYMNEIENLMDEIRKEEFHEKS